MNTKIDQALERLTRVLPLQQRQAECSEEVRDLHRHVLRSFVVRGRILARNEMEQHAGNAADAIAVLKKQGMVTFSAHGEPVGAYPFTMDVREHRVRINGHQVHAMCALDALAISPMYGMQTQIDSRCRVTGHPVCIKQAGMAIENPQEAGDTHLGIAWSAAKSNACCADSLCMEMIFLQDASVARQWLDEDAANRETFTLAEAVEFAGRLFVPLVA